MKLTRWHRISEFLEISWKVHDQKNVNLFQALKLLKVKQFILINYSNIGLRYLEEGLQPLTSLQEISLDFTKSVNFDYTRKTHLLDSCEKIANRGLNDFGECFQALNSLRKIVLDFTISVNSDQLISQIYPIDVMQSQMMDWTI